MAGRWLGRARLLRAGAAATGAATIGWHVSSSLGKPPKPEGEPLKPGFESALPRSLHYALVGAKLDAAGVKKILAALEGDAEAKKKGQRARLRELSLVALKRVK